MEARPESTEYGGDRKLADIARESSVALRDTSKWLHRRVERIRPTERLIIRRRVSVDFSIPPNLPAFHGSADESKPNVYFVPVALLRKWPPLMDFDLRGEDGRPLPLLTTGKNREVDAAALVGLAPPGDERNCLEALLESVAQEDEPGARRALDAVGAFIDAHWEDMSADDQQAWPATLRTCASIVSNSLLWVRVEAFPGQRQIIKFAFMESAPRELVLRRRFLSAFSWAPRRAQYLLANLGERGSYHLEIEPPPELAIYRVGLELYPAPPRVSQRLRGPRTGVWLSDVPRRLMLGIRDRYREFFGASRDAGSGQRHVPEGGTARTMTYRRNSRERAYFYVAGTHHQYGLASVDLGIGNRALISSSLRASLAITALLAILWQARGSVVHHLDGAVALLIIFPALLALLVVRSGEHPMLRQMISGVRLLLVSAAVLPVVDGVILLSYAHPRAGDVNFGFLLVFLLGAAISALLFLSWLLPGIDLDNPAGGDG